MKIYSLHNYGKLSQTLFAVALWSTELIQCQAVQILMTWGEMGVWEKTLFIECAKAQRSIVNILYGI